MQRSRLQITLNDNNNNIDLIVKVIQMYCNMHTHVYQFYINFCCFHNAFVSTWISHDILFFFSFFQLSGKNKTETLDWLAGWRLPWAVWRCITRVNGAQSVSMVSISTTSGLFAWYWNITRMIGNIMNVRLLWQFTVCILGKSFIYGTLSLWSWWRHS